MELRHLLTYAFVAALVVPRCDCSEGGDLGRTAVEMQLTMIETDPCSGAAVPRRIPDDYKDGRLVASTDFGSGRERTFEVRSLGTAPLSLKEVRLSEETEAFTLTVKDGSGAEASLPLQLPPTLGNEAPGAIIEITYNPAFGRPNTAIQLLINTDDPERENVSFTLAAGRGRLEICGTNGCVEMPEVQFGAIPRGMSDTKPLVLRNIGDGDLDLRDLKLESASTEFCAPEVSSLPEGVVGCTPVNLCKILKAGEDYTINVSYSPVDSGEDTGVIKVVSGDALRGTVDVPINGSGSGPAVCACLVSGTDCTPSPVIDFGAVGVGATERRTLRLVSCGTEAVEISEADLERDAMHPYFTAAEFSISRAFATGRFDPGQFSEGEISYAPVSAGQHRGSVRYTQAPSDNKSWIILVGTAATCDLEAVPQTVSFGAIASGGQADRQVLMVNNGARDCTVSAITDPIDGFSLVNKPQLPLTVPSGQSIALTARFNAPATQTLMPYSSSFAITSDEASPNDINTVQLNAQGGGMPQCTLDIQPVGNTIIPSRQGQLQFGATTIGSSKMLSIRLSNTGNTDCVLQSYRLTTNAGPQFTASTPTPTPLIISAGLASSIDVTFAPTGPANNPFGLYGPLTNYVDFEVAGPGIAQTSWSIGLNAIPVVPTIDIIPDTVDFGLITWDNPRPPDNRSSCGSETRSVRIYNSGTGSLTVNSISIDQTSDQVFLITQVTNGGAPVNAPYSMTIAAGGSATVDLRFYPTRISPAQHNGLLIVDNSVTTQSTVPLMGTGTPNAQQIDTFRQLSDNMVDILWVIDDSGSMQEEQTALANNLGSFIGFADMQSVDYQVGVVSTDCDSPQRSGRLVTQGGNPANKIVTAATSPSATQVFAQNSGLGTNGSGTEQGLNAAKLALSAPLKDTENAGFIRPDARLAIIIVSDEEDQSPGPVDLYVDFFRSIKGFQNPQLISLSAIAGDVPNGCATAEAGQRYYDAVSRFGGQFESVCSSSWATLLNNIGFGVFAVRSAWTLSRAADASTIVVRVNGMVVPQNGTNGWTYDPATNAVIFHGSAIPPVGAQLEIRYGALCIP